MPAARKGGSRGDAHQYFEKTHEHPLSPKASPGENLSVS